MKKKHNSRYDHSDVWFQNIKQIYLIRIFDGDPDNFTTLVSHETVKTAILISFLFHNVSYRLQKINSFDYKLS